MYRHRITIKLLTKGGLDLQTAKLVIEELAECYLRLKRSDETLITMSQQIDNAKAFARRIENKYGKIK